MRWPNCLTWSDSAFCVASLPICTSAIPPCAAFSMNLRSLDETVDAFSFIELIAFGDDVDCWLMLDDGGLADFAAPVASGVRVCAATAAATQNDTTPTIFAGIQKRLVDMRFLRNVTSRCLWQRRKLRGGSRGTRDQQISCNIRACERGSRPLRSRERHGVHDGRTFVRFTAAIVKPRRPSAKATFPKCGSGCRRSVQDVEAHDAPG